MSVRLLKFLFPFLQLAINKQNFFHFALNIRGPARSPPPPPSRVFNFLLHYVSYLPKSYLWTKKMKGIYFSTLATKSGFLLNFSWPSLLNILDSVFCLSQTTTKFVLLTILNHIIFIPYFVNGLGFFFFWDSKLLLLQQQCENELTNRLPPSFFMRTNHSTFFIRASRSN